VSPETKGLILLAVIKILMVFTVYNVGVMMVIWAERRVSAFKQYRLGPNRVWIFGLGQSVADGVKNIMKEETFPAQADRLIFLLAPLVSFVPALLVFAVIPYAAPLPLEFDFALPVLGQFTHTGTMPVVIADLPVGFLFVLAVSSLGVYGIVLAGWASNSKYSFLGGLRASAQMVSYEVALGFSITSVFVLVGNVKLSDIIVAQQQSLPFVLPLTLGFILFFVSALAENNRLPFDLPETESELITGYHTEYSSMKFSMFFIAEYAHIITGASLLATLFFGGWDIPFWRPDQPSLLYTLATLMSFSVKTLFFIYVYIWIRWTLPRFRFDQLMQLGWKFMLPLALMYVLVIAGTALILEQGFGMTFGPAYAWILFALNLVLVFVVFGILDRGRVLQGAQHRRMEV
jgi:NADH-quinone oxidoreductase subunit H